MSGINDEEIFGRDWLMGLNLKVWVQTFFTSVFSHKMSKKIIMMIFETILLVQTYEPQATLVPRELWTKASLILGRDKF